RFQNQQVERALQHIGFLLHKRLLTTADNKLRRCGPCGQALLSIAYNKVPMHVSFRASAGASSYLNRNGESCNRRDLGTSELESNRTEDRYRPKFRPQVNGNRPCAHQREPLVASEGRNRSR